MRRTITDDQIADLNHKLDMTLEKINAITASAATRADVAALQRSIDDRFMEKSVATEKFNAIEQRQGGIERQLEAINDRFQKQDDADKSNMIATRNNIISWIFNGGGLVLAFTSVFLSLLFFLFTHHP